MAASLKIAIAALLVCALQPALAESLPDPTRPALAETGLPGAAAKRAPRGLQTIIISPNYRAAIINGETVRLGGKVGNSRLVEVREDSVVLQNAAGRRVLELFPRVGVSRSEAAPLPHNDNQENGSEQPGPTGKDAGGAK